MNEDMNVWMISKQTVVKINLQINVDFYLMCNIIHDIEFLEDQICDEMDTDFNLNTFLSPTPSLQMKTL